MPICPLCSKEIHHEAEVCPVCQDSLLDVEQTLRAHDFKRYDVDTVPFSRVCSESGILNKQERDHLKKFLEKLEHKLPPILLSVYFPHVSGNLLLKHCFWTMNHLTTTKASFPNHPDPLDPEWLLMLIIDSATKRAFFMWGYSLEPYIEESKLFKVIHDQRILLRDEEYFQAACVIMKKAVRTIAKRARKQLRHPDRAGLSATRYPANSLQEASES